MILPVLGAASAGAVGMAGMTSAAGATRSAGLLGFLLSYGPAILLSSAIAFTLSIGIRRWTGALPALVGGLLMYWGMYGQPRLAMMCAAIFLGMILWAALYVWAGRARGVGRAP
jgi:hypothetical protein